MTLRRRRPWAVAALLAALLAVCAGVVAVCEARGWSFLAQPAQRWLSTRLARPVQLVGADGQGFRLQLWGPIRLSVAELRIGNPGWAGPGALLEADAVQLHLRWRDALAWRPGRSLALQSLQADRLDLQLQRLADGRDNWTLATSGPAGPAPPERRIGQRIADVMTIRQLAVAGGRVQLQDAVAALQLDARFSQQAATAQRPGALTAEASGSYRGKPVRALLRAGAPSAWLADAQALEAPVPMTLSVHAGDASLGFGGEVQRLLHTPQLSGRYRLSGPSLAAVGEALGITLPQTRRFDLRGRLAQDGARWFTVIDQATVGASRLGGAFTYERAAGQVPLLAGRLTGAALLLQDLGPAVGGATDTEARPVRAGGRVLPDRPFNLPSLRAMNAEVLVALDALDFGTPQLKSAGPVRGLIRLRDGMLAVEQLQVALAQGQLGGQIRLDGRQAPARWDLDLNGRNLRIEQWVQATRRTGQAAYASGRLDGRLTLSGRGNSTAELLAGADGRARLHWRDGQISHLLVEAAGLDIAQGLGVLLRGDEPLPVLCGAADLQIKAGQLTPQVLLVDTRDSLLWVDGKASLATERLQLLAHVRPKDWSPLTLRAPLHIDGMLGAPAVSLDKTQLLQRALPAALLALVHPLAALLPLMDNGDDDGPTALGCRALVQRFRTAGFDAPRP
jgi:uncharacterized protein involved in outer membrane biogenesis